MANPAPATTPESVPARPVRPGRPLVPRLTPTTFSMAPDERRSHAVTYMSMQAALVGAFIGLIAIVSLGAPEARRYFLFFAPLAAVILAAAWTGWQCRPLGKPLLMVYSALVVTFIPIGTIQGVFQFIHLTKPEATLMFAEGDRFSEMEYRDLQIFRDANPNLAAWLRITSFLMMLIFGLRVLFSVACR